MKKLALVFAIVASAVIVQAKPAMKDSGSSKSMSSADRDKLDGCGLGWEVTDQRTFVGTTTRGTTNAFVPPSFGMTSGTMGCEKIDFAQNNPESATFVASNYQVLKSELAEGKGEYVTAMIESFGCSNAQAPALAAKLQSNYQTVVAPAQNAAQLHNNVSAAVGQCI